MNRRREEFFERRTVFEVSFSFDEEETEVESFFDVKEALEFAEDTLSRECLWVRVDEIERTVKKTVLLAAKGPKK